MSGNVDDPVEDEEEMFQRLCKEGLRNSDRNADEHLVMVPKFYSKVRKLLDTCLYLYIFVLKMI